MKKYFSYVRVSTVRQGELGVSLQQQTDAIERYASKQELQIVEWFDEQETAAKRGRPVFSKMLQALKAGKASGVIMHKIDRSARNLKDWADLGELIDSGMEVHFANEALDLNSRGGRLSADIQAVVAADYIRNLREESKKGFYGRLKQGILPMPAPVGYLNIGPGKPKAIDPIKAPLVRQAFELYASGTFSLELLVEEMYRRGLRSRSGQRITRNGMSLLLNRRFYMGIIDIQKTGQQFIGAHQPIVSPELFAAVQRMLKGRFGRKTQKHRLLFSRLIKCTSCAKSVIGEVKKGYVYYRCHTKSCPTVNIAERVLRELVRTILIKLQFSADEKKEFAEHISNISAHWDDEKQSIERALALRLQSIQAKLQKLTDAYFDGLIDRAEFENRKITFELERKTIDDEIKGMKSGAKRLYAKNLAEFIELAGSAYLLYENGNVDEKRQLLRLITSECTLDCKTPMFILSPAFQVIADREKTPDGSASCAIHRDVPGMIANVLEVLTKESTRVVTGKFNFLTALSSLCDSLREVGRFSAS